MEPFNCPTKVRVGFADYDIVGMTEEEAKAADHHGMTDVNNYRITVDFSGAPHRQVMVVIHELCHAMYDMGDLVDGETEEKVVSVMANMLCQVMRDNPALFIRAIAALVPQGG